jgi:hypothetical protein
MKKTRLCKSCKVRFEVKSNHHWVCSLECSIDLKNKKPKKKKKHISPVSKKRAEELATYRKVRDKYLKEHPICEVDDCNNPSDHIHHMNGRTGKRLYDDEFFMAVGGCCHPKRIHENPAWSRENGYLV